MSDTEAIPSHRRAKVLNLVRVYLPNGFEAWMCTSTMWSGRARARSRVHLLGSLFHPLFTLHPARFLSKQSAESSHLHLFMSGPALGMTLHSSHLHTVYCVHDIKTENGANRISSSPLLTPNLNGTAAQGVFIPMRVHHHHLSPLHASDHARRTGHRPIISYMRRFISIYGPASSSNFSSGSSLLRFGTS